MRFLFKGGFYFLFLNIFCGFYFEGGFYSRAASIEENTVLGNDRGDNFGRGRGIAPISSRAGALRYIVSRIHSYVAYIFRHHANAFRICTRISLVHDEPQKRFEHVGYVHDFYAPTHFSYKIKKSSCENYDITFISVV